jgi:hypothetical protein
MTQSIRADRVFALCIRGHLDAASLEDEKQWEAHSGFTVTLKIEQAILDAM